MQDGLFPSNYGAFNPSRCDSEYTRLEGEVGQEVSSGASSIEDPVTLPKNAQEKLGEINEREEPRMCSPTGLLRRPLIHAVLILGCIMQVLGTWSRSMILVVARSFRESQIKQSVPYGTLQKPPTLQHSSVVQLFPTSTIGVLRQIFTRDAPRLWNIDTLIISRW